VALNIAGAAQVSLTVFGGLVTEQSAVDLPEGASPDNQDVEYVPGSVFSRRCLERLFATALGNVTLSYAKTFVLPTGDVKNLYLDSSGNLWVEDETNTPGTVTLLVEVHAQTYAKSITAFGREYIAVTDGLHGQEMPLQWDGTYLDRVTQDGPGASPQVANYSLPEVAMAASGSAPTLTITGIYPDQRVAGNWTTINIYVASGAASVPIGSLVFVSGTGSPFDSSQGYLVVTNPGPSGAVTCSAFFAGSQGVYLGSGTLTIGTGGITAVRQGNTVTINTTAAHNLLVGYQALIAGLPPLPVGGGISSIVINNEDNPGIATVTTNNPHGLVPENIVLIQDVPNKAVSATLTGITWAGGIATVTMNSAHGLLPGALVTLVLNNPSPSGLAAQYAMTTTVLSVPSPDTFTYALTPFLSGFADSYTGYSGDEVLVSWPTGSTPDENYYEVVAAPTPTTFQVQIEYTDGTWTSGTVSFPWDGTFYVQSVPGADSFTYQQYGPNGSSNTAGTVTPWGQIAPGLRQMQLLFLTRQGYLTRPSPPVNIECNGGQYLSVTNIPVGPSNVVARILAFTGAGGGLFFYIPTPPQINAQIVGTATQINDNTTTAVTLDFGDPTLFSALGISIPGNTPANQIIIEGALAFGAYADRLVTWGQRNRIQNLLNMGFEGGAFYSTPTLPCGWDNTTGGGALQPLSIARGTNWPGYCWEVDINAGDGNFGTLTQPMYEDAYGAPIAQPNTQYAFRCWLKVNSGSSGVLATISSSSTGFSTTVLLNVPAGPGGAQFVQGNFNQLTPSAIPSDLMLTVQAAGAGTVQIDEMSIIYEQSPYLDTTFYMSYVDNPEAFDGVTGKSGEVTDPHKIMDIAQIRENLYYLTQDPGGRLHETSDNGTTEPAGWTYNEVAANCGMLSAFCLTKSQADDSSSAGGEEWFAWMSATGPRIFGGDQPWKIGQELQPDWDSISTAVPFVGQTAFPTPAQLTCWALNDPDQREILFGLPIAVTGTLITNPNRVYVLSYRELETAFQIGTTGPIHTSFTGRLIATDHARKWTRWNMTMNGAALMIRPGTQNPNLSVVLFGGNGAPLGNMPGYGNAYTLNGNKFSDDDYGLVSPYYVTYFFVGHDQEQQLSWQTASGQRIPLGGGQKLLQYMTGFVGSPPTQFNTQSVLNIEFLCNTMDNPWPLGVSRILYADPRADLECAGGSAIGYRIAVKFYSTPIAPSNSLDNGFSLSHLTLWLKGDAHLPVRGASSNPV
jgi:hypothetical protein